MANLIQIETVLNSVDKLFTLPDLCLRLRELVEDPECSTSEIARLISTDPALTARLLKLVNSPLYYMPGTIASVNQAISLIGTEQLCNLALATSAATIIKSAEGSYLEVKTFWQHCVYTGLIAKYLIYGHSSGGESLFIAGLLHNIGKMAVIAYDPDLAMSAVSGQNKKQSTWRHEKEVFGFTFADVGGVLLEKWRLPAEIVVPILRQHDPCLGYDFIKYSCAIHIAVHVASAIVEESGNEDEHHDYSESVERDSLLILAISQKNIINAVAEVEEIGPEVLQIFSI
ncbi:MAG: HDOD domain-containing protein [Methylococcales bacterium]